jgi:signal transduction histidine kinase
MVDFVIRNLLSNAIKFTSPNGKVLIDLKEKETFLEISIIDNGIGLSIDDQQKLFRSDIQFSRMGTSKERGTGLGLILCKEFIEKCSGKVSLESKQGEGATFKFTLPLHNN